MAQEDAMTVKWHRIKKKNTNLRHSNLPVFIYICLFKQATIMDTIFDKNFRFNVKQLLQESSTSIL